jgi:hypothetical protein
MPQHFGGRTYGRADVHTDGRTSATLYRSLNVHNLFVKNDRQAYTKYLKLVGQTI